MKPTPAAADAVIFVLLDAFRHDYLERTRFLKSLAPRSLVGQLEEPFGFCPRGAYFGGLSMAQQGYTNLFHYDPSRSDFRWTRDLRAFDASDSIGRALGSEIIRRARTGLSPFSARTANPWGIPLDWQSHFRISERHAPWDRHVGYRSLFHVLDDAERLWCEASWPFLDLAGNATDGVVAGHAIEQLRGDHAFAFVHLPLLDGLGHAAGPGSQEVGDGIADIDRFCELISDRALGLFDDPVLVFAGDHGMLPVIRRIDALTALRDTGLRFGHDFAFFIDSTMVRCWFFTDTARRTTHATLTALGGGHWIDDDERRRWGIDGLDARNFDDCFLADPGVLFSPSFFNGDDEHAPKGMHGYAPEVADNRALFLAYRPAARARADVGIVEARRLYPSFLSWLGFESRDFTDVEPVISPTVADERSRWFVSSGPAADALVDAQLARTVTAVRERAPDTCAVVLAGGFGRGEGTPSRADGNERPSNDYDVLVLGIDGQELDGLGDDLAREFQIDFVDLFGGRRLERGSIARLSDFDLRYGSRVLWGDPMIVERLGALAPAELDLVEAAFLVGNRLGGLLLGLTGHMAAPGEECAYLGRQTAKFLIALADAWLIAIGDYSVSYAARQRRFADLAVAGGFSADTRALIDRAYAAKLGTSAEPALSVPLPILMSALDESRRALGWNAGSTAMADALGHAVRRHVTSVDLWRQRALALGLSPRDDNFWPQGAEAVYQAVFDVLQAWTDGPAATAVAARDALSPSFDGMDAVADADAALIVARLWLAFFH